MNESAIGAGVSTESVGAASQAAESPTASQSSGVPSEQPSTDVKQPVQGEQPSQTQQSDDPLAGFPSDDDLKAAVANKTPFAEQAARIKEAYSTLKPRFDELSGRFTPLQPIVDRFEGPEQLQSVVALHDGLVGWEKDTQTGELVPATLAGVQQIQQQYPRHADFIAADLLNLPTTDPETGKYYEKRIDLALESMATEPEQRAKVARMFGLVEPSSVSPQWQPTAEELAIVRPELQDTYKKLPYEEREELKLASPDFINRTLEKEKFQQDLIERDKQTQLNQQQQIQARENYIAQQAAQAGDNYVNSQLSEALTTFHNSVVEQCNFISPLDPANLPDGITAEQVPQMNQQIAASNKAEAAQITLSVIGLVNEQTRPFVLPLLKEIGVIDDKLIKELDDYSNGFGNNGRNYGDLEYRGRLQANGNGFKPDASITNLNNEAKRNLNRLVHVANTIKGRLLEKRSQFFQMKATDHNQTLNSVAATRPSANGGVFNPATAASGQFPQGKLTRAEIDRQFG
jgi:hypothetical protein